MKVLLYGRYGEFPWEVKTLVESAGLAIVSANPEVVITYGGDGTLLGAERDYPGIPKLPLKNSDHCHLCSALPNEELLKLLSSRSLTIREYFKLEATAGNKKITALNDIIIAHKYPNNAIRFKVNDGPEMIGDGVVITTPFGATGYFYSVTKTTFSAGIGLAYNNLHNDDQQWQLLPETAVIKVILTRGPAVLAADNDPNLIDLKENEETVIKKAPETAKILTPEQTGLGGAKV